MNINLSLVEQLDRQAPQIINNIKKAHEKGNLELTSSGAYHPIFPLLPDDEINKQLKINDQGNRRLLTDSFQPKGVFPPEMAFNEHLVSLFKANGYKWTIADDLNLRLFEIEVPYNKIYSCNDFPVFLRSNFWSNKFANYKGQWKNSKEFEEELYSELDRWMGSEDGYLIIALDGETFGHHHPDLGEEFLVELFQGFRNYKNHICLEHLSNLSSLFPHIPQYIPCGSWSTDQVDIENKDYFSRWESPQNKVHTLQWKFTNYVLGKVRSNSNEEINQKMDKALFSCQYWWASFWKFNPDEIYKGAFNMMSILQNSAELLEDNYELIKKGERIFRELIIEVEKERDNRRIKHA